MFFDDTFAFAQIKTLTHSNKFGHWLGSRFFIFNFFIDKRKLSGQCIVQGNVDAI